MGNEIRVLKPIAVIDIDGTLCEVGPRQRFADQNPPDWDRFYMDDFNDQPILNVCDFVRHLSSRYEVFFCTSRRETVRTKTQIWLKRHLAMNPSDYTLIMRANSDESPDVVSKIRWFRECTTEEERRRVQLVVEDSAAMAAMWREMFGYLCLQVQ